LKQDPSMFRDRIYTLVQQAGTNQGLSTHQDFNKLALQQAAAVDPIDGEQRAGEVNLNPAREPSLAGRIPGGPLQMFSPALQMSSAFSQNGWSSELGQKVMWLARADLQQAQLQLNPKHLGPLEIKITMNADQQINVNFLTHSAAVKDALDQATPRLREVFDQSGLNLADVNVQQESNKQNREQSQSNPQPSHGTSYLAENVHEDLSAPLGTHGSVLSTNIVDFYA
jgi:flagellar hook-length control protein FliK